MITNCVVDKLPCAIITTLLEVGGDTLPGRILPRQHAKFPATHDQIQDRLDHRSHLQTAGSTSWLCSRNQVFDTIPTFDRLNRLDRVGSFSYSKSTLLIDRLSPLFKQPLRTGVNPVRGDAHDSQGTGHRGGQRRHFRASHIHRPPVWGSGLSPTRTGTCLPCVVLCEFLQPNRFAVHTCTCGRKTILSGFLRSRDQSMPSATRAALHRRFNGCSLRWSE